MQPHTHPARVRGSSWLRFSVPHKPAKPPLRRKVYEAQRVTALGDLRDMSEPLRAAVLRLYVAEVRAWRVGPQLWHLRGRHRWLDLTSDQLQVMSWRAMYVLHTVQPQTSSKLN
jgi:hypothetical protein